MQLKRNVQVSLPTRSNQDRQLHEDAVMSATRETFRWWRRGGRGLQDDRLLIAASESAGIVITAQKNTSGLDFSLSAQNRTELEHTPSSHSVSSHVMFVLSWSYHCGIPSWKLSSNTAEVTDVLSQSDNNACSLGSSQCSIFRGQTD